MKKNEKKIDRLVRVGIAMVAIVGAAILGFGSVLGIILLVVAAIMLVTAAVGTCPIYLALGKSTCSVP